MKKLLNQVFVAIGLSMLFCCQVKNDQSTTRIPKYEATQESLASYQVPDWWLNSKFGIYFHWGPYSVPAHKTEWYSHYMYEKDHPIRDYHEETYGPLSEFGYKDFIPMFTAEKFDADEWAELFKRAGAQFAGPVAEHADGFAMWDSALTEWDAKDMGPKRDIVGEMEKAIRKQGMKYIITYHRHWLYAWYPTWDNKTDAYDPKLSGIYGPKVPEGTFVMAEENTDPLPNDEFNEEWLARLEELTDKYKPDIIWFDNKMDIIKEEYRLRFLSSYYNKAEEWGSKVVCTYKFTDLPKGSAILDLERSRMSEKKDFPWLTDDSIDWIAWCNIQNPRYKSVNRIIDFLVDVVSKNGSVLLNIPPTAKGEIADEVRSRLFQIGDWIEINKEAIIDTRPWKVYGEGTQKIIEGHLSEDQNPEATAEDIRFTTKDNYIFAIALDWPGEKMIIKSFATKEGLLEKTIKNVTLLGYKGKLVWSNNEAGLEVIFPDEVPCEHAFSLKIELG